MKCLRTIDRDIQQLRQLSFEIIVGEISERVTVAESLNTRPRAYSQPARPVRLFKVRKQGFEEAVNLHISISL